MAGPFFWLLLAGYTWGMHTEGARLWTGAAFASATVVLGAAVDAYQDGFTSYLSTVCLIALAPILFGQVLRNRARLNRALHSRAERAERERAAAADAAALEERTRIAGDLHDVVAHALSAMTVQAGAARRMAERDPARAEASFAVVESTGPRGADRAAPAARRAAPRGRGARARAAAEPRARALADPARDAPPGLPSSCGSRASPRRSPPAST